APADRPRRGARKKTPFLVRRDCLAGSVGEDCRAAKSQTGDAWWAVALLDSIHIDAGRFIGSLGAADDEGDLADPFDVPLNAVAGHQRADAFGRAGEDQVAGLQVIELR